MGRQGLRNRGLRDQNHEVRRSDRFGAGLARRRGMVRLLISGALLTTALGCSYRPGTFAYGMKAFPGTRATVGCLDIAIDRRSDYDGNAVLQYSFANRCESKQVIDLAGLRVVGRDLDGNEHSLTPFDPGGQIRPMPLDARLAGAETLAYSSIHKLVQVCVDAGSFSKDVPERWLCFARAEDPTPPQDDLRSPSEQSYPTDEANRTLIEDDARAEVP